MPYPPFVPPPTRDNNTPQADNHPQDHNDLANALNDIIAELGPFDLSGTSGSLAQRLVPWQLDGVNLRLAVPDTGTIKLRIDATDVLALTETGVVLTGTLGVSGGATVGGGLNVAGSLGAGNTTVADLTSTGNQSFAGLTSMNGAQVANPAGSDGVNITRPSTNAGIGINILSVVNPNNGAWGNRPLVIQQAGANTGAGIGFHSVSASKAGVWQFFNDEFTANNSLNNGYIPVRASAFPVASSIRYKHDVLDVESDGCLEAIMELRPVSFILNGTDEHRCGFIAEEVDSVLVEAIHRDPDGAPSAIDYGVVTAVLVSAVQELADQVRLLREAA